ncbi:hypothetical protein AAVH_37062, partial [Aphelenchoides avenae]
SQLRKAVAGLFVDEVWNNLKNELFAKLLIHKSMGDDVQFDFDTLLAEDPQRVLERENAANMIQLLTNATAKIAEISATAI